MAIADFAAPQEGPLSPPGLRNALAIKVREQVDQVEVLEKERSVWAGTLSGVRLLHGGALRRGVDGAVALFETGINQPDSPFVSVYKVHSPSGKLLVMAFLEAGCGDDGDAKVSRRSRDGRLLLQGVRPATRSDAHYCAEVRFAAEAIWIADAQRETVARRKRRAGAVARYRTPTLSGSGESITHWRAVFRKG